MSFADKVDAGYRKYRNPYHNPNHAADVAQTTHFFVCQTGLLNWLSEVEVFAMLFAAAIHDFEARFKKMRYFFIILILNHFYRKFQ